MRFKFTAAVLLAGLALLAASPSRAQQVYTPAYPYPYPGMAAPWAEGWAGFGGQNNWYGGYAGGNYALNHNVWADGILLRADGYGGHYDYSTPFVAGGRSNVTYGGGDFLVGYRKVLPGV